MSAHGFGGQAQQLGCSGVVGGQQKGSNALHFCECFLVRRDVSRGHVQVVGKEGGTGTHQCFFGGDVVVVFIGRATERSERNGVPVIAVH